MTRITAIINQKGGVGKTTTAHALATGLTDRKHNVLVIDSDPQGNISYIMQADRSRPGTFEALSGKPIADLIQHTPQGDIISSGEDLVGADRTFTALDLLRKALKPILRRYDHIVIDCPPATGILTYNALTAATDLIVPVGANVLSLQGMGQLFDSVQRIQQHTNPTLTFAGLLICRKTGRAIVTRQFTETFAAVAQDHHVPVYATAIREGVAIQEAQAMQTSIFDTHRKAAVTADYTAFISEYIAQEGR